MQHIILELKDRSAFYILFFPWTCYFMASNWSLVELLGSRGINVILNDRVVPVKCGNVQASIPIPKNTITQRYQDQAYLTLAGYSIQANLNYLVL